MTSPGSATSASPVSLKDLHVTSDTLTPTQPEKWRFNADMQDIVSFAQKLSNARSVIEISDRDVLMALLLSNRLFSPLDSYFKSAGARPKALYKSFQRLLKAEGESTPASKSVLLNANRIRKNEGEADTKDHIDITHVLVALSESQDPLITALFRDFGITPETVRQGIASSKKHDVFRIACFMTRELAEVLVFVLFFLIVIKSFLGELRLIPSESMVPTLAVDDRIVIERVSTWFRPYQKKDILVFYPPMTQLKQDPWSIFLRLTGFSGLLYKKEDNIDVAYIKRLVGEPGDIVDVRPNVGVLVNGKLTDEPYTREKANSCTLEPKFVAVPNNPNDNHRTLFLGESGEALTDLEIWQFELRNGSLRNPVSIPKNQLPEVLKTNSLDYASKACLPVEVPEGYYYLMGDNRNESLDSRYWGFEPKERAIGRAVFRLWPLNRISSLTP